MSEMTEVEIVELIKYIRSCENDLANYSNKLRQSIYKIFDVIDSVKISIDIIDDVPFYLRQWWDGDKAELRLCIADHNMEVHEKWADGSTSTFDVPQLSRVALKALVKSGRLFEFLRKVARTLKEAGQEYRQVAEIAERMAQAAQTAVV